MQLVRSFLPFKPEKQQYQMEWFPSFSHIKWKEKAIKR